MAETNHVCDVSRRSFVKGSLTAAVGAGAASWLTGCSPKPVADTGGTESEPTPVVEDNDEIFRGTCRCNCYGGCYLNIHVRDGKIVRTSMRDLPETAWNLSLIHIWWKGCLPAMVSAGTTSGARLCAAIARCFWGSSPSRGPR